MTIDIGAVFKITATTEGQAQVDKLNESVKNLGKTGQSSAAQTANAFRMLPAQFTDIATQLAGGQNPFLILLQQGGQIKDSFGGFKNTFQAFAQVLTPARLAIGGVAGAVALLGAAFYKGEDEANEFNKTMALSGNVANVTYAQFRRLAAQLSSTSGGTIGNNKDLLMGALGTGAFGQQSLEPAVAAMARVRELSGQTSDAVVKDFASMATGVANWAAAHNRAYAYLTIEQFQYIKALEQAGNTEAAMAYNSRLLNAELEKRRPQLGFLEKAWKSLGESASLAWDKMLGLGRPDSIEDKINDLTSKLNAKVGRGGINALQGKDRERAESQLAALRAQKEASDQIAKADADKKAADRKAIDEEASGLTDRMRNAGLDAQNIQFKAASDAKVRILQDQQMQIDALHAKELLSDRDYIKQSAAIREQEIAQQIAVAKRQLDVEAQRPTKDQGDAANKANKLLQLNAQLSDLEDQRRKASAKGDLDAAVSDDKKSKALRYYTEDLKYQNDMLALEAQQVDMTDFAYQQLVESKQREQDIRVKTRGMVASEAEGYRAAAAAAGDLRASIEKVNNEQSRTWQYGAKSALKTYTEEISNAAKQTEKFMTNSFHSIEDALVEFATTGKLNFRSLATSIISDLVRIQIQQSIMKPLTGALGGMFASGLGGAFGGLFGGGAAGISGTINSTVGSSALNPGGAFGGFSFDGGGYTGSDSRSGGLDGKGGFMALLHPQETVIDHTRGQSFGGGVSVNVIVNAGTGTVDASGGAGDANRLGVMVAAAVKQVLTNEKRQGGMLYGT
jgi:lambda family phage tail tape measure protein